MTTIRLQDRRCSVFFWGLEKEADKERGGGLGHLLGWGLGVLEKALEPNSTKMCAKTVSNLM